jgi:hypothetical protein
LIFDISGVTVGELAVAELETELRVEFEEEVIVTTPERCVEVFSPLPVCDGLLGWDVVDSTFVVDEVVGPSRL